MSRKYFCNRCGRELSASEMVPLLGYDLRRSWCKEAVKSKKLFRPLASFFSAFSGAVLCFLSLFQELVFLLLNLFVPHADHARSVRQSILEYK